MVDFGATKPYPAYLRDHFPDFGTYRGKPRAPEDAAAAAGFRPASGRLVFNVHNFECA